MYSRYLRPFSMPPRRRWLGGGSRYSSNSSSFDLYSGCRYRYGNSSRNRIRRRRHFWNRDRHFYPSSVTDNVPEEPEPEAPELPSEEVLKVIHVKNVDFHIKENTEAHRTDKYEQTEDRVNDLGQKEEAELVIRRGQDFQLTLNLDRPYQKEKDDLRLEFKIGRNPRATKGTLVQIKVNEKNPPAAHDVTQWRSSIKKTKGNDVTLSVYPAANCIIGEWDISIETVLESDGKPRIYEYDEPDNIFIILNPFCKDDTVYFSPEGLLDEYILNDQGCQWFGSFNKPKSRSWFFGQFEDGILEASLHLLRKGHGLEINRDMADPVAIGRTLSKMVNSNGDNGVLVGNWSGDYAAGTRPTSWGGSVSILKEYMDTKGSVKFGQCWVFSGVMTTVCRALGLPCRSVTNFESAHDTDKSATIDKYFMMVDKKRKDLKMGSDSIWNFHVWNEIFCKRIDLPHGYDGWQVVDATPQEKSDDVFQCGPCPLAAVKLGHLWLPHDATFIFAEVNGNVVHHELVGTDLRVASVDRKKVGRKISTKIPNGKPLSMMHPITDTYDRLDLTNEYKHLDGSKEEGRVQEAVARFIGSNTNFDLRDEEVLPIVDNIETVMVGSPFTFKCGLHNVSRSDRTVDVVISMNMVKYTGDVLDEVISKSFEGQKLKSGEKKIVSVEVTVDDYLEKLKGEDSMKIEVMGKVLETGEMFIRDDIFTFDHPDIEVTADGPFKVDEPFDVTLKVKNPLTIPLTGLSLRLEGPGIRANGKIIKPKQTTIPAMGIFTEKISLTPKKFGVKSINASLDTEELPDITGQIEIEVPKPKPDTPKPRAPRN